MEYSIHRWVENLIFFGEYITAAIVLNQNYVLLQRISSIYCADRKLIRPSKWIIAPSCVLL